MKTVRQLLAAKGGAVYSIAPKARVYEALRLMAEKEVGALVVLDGGRLAGILSERDYARKVALQGRSSYATPVSEIMTEAVIIVLPQQTVGDCMQMMTDHHLRHLPVMGNGKLIGLLSIGDLVKATTVQQAELIRHLEGYIRGE